MRGVAMVCLLLAGCDGAAPADAAIHFDAAMPDATAPTDASGFDAGPAPFDSGFIGTPCVVGDVPGTCEHVSTCVGDRRPTPGLCPGPTEIQCCTRVRDAGSESCDPSARPTPNEGLTEAPGDGGCPAGMARVDAFCIDRFEASLVMVDDAGPVGSWSPYHPPDGVRVAATSVEGAVPQGYIRGTQAADACAEAGKRLCTDAEWLRACRGAEARVYPYGDTREDGRCNDARDTHPVIERFGTSEDWIWSRLGDACINQLPDSLARTGDHPGCVTPEGVYDLMGNLHEWTADPAGTFRGGYYVDTVRNGEGCLYRTTAHSMSHWDYSTGFRCCADPP
ncbi:MAG TPA: SUMF1/EgtB/PvdO family nonheme iron enzyme [Sandaracinaceae bacterium LLY-WYZ-13_1]|nr:SUMF1/EgtB/PvdO family nonheme iron enzyme [Sandaracinaceae bacterium LLY-WYZ-13_1]